MKYKNFLLRAVNLLLILGVLWQYQQVALVRAAAVSQRKQEIAEVEAYNASVLQAQSAAQAEQSGYRDCSNLCSRQQPWQMFQKRNTLFHARRTSRFSSVQRRSP